MCDFRHVQPGELPCLFERRWIVLKSCNDTFFWCRDAEETIPVETGVVPDPSTTASVPLEDLTVEEVPGVDAGRLGATMSMLQDVIRSVEVPSAASGSGSAALSSSTSGSLAVVDVEKAKQTTTPSKCL